MRQLSFERVNGWGGRRARAGRKNRSGQVSHRRRERVTLKTPVHVTMKLRPRIASLRNRILLNEFRRALTKAKGSGLAVIHYSLQGDHLHMIVESANIGPAMKSFGACFGKAIRKAIGGRGGVFRGRYHGHVLRTLTEMKRAIQYVLTNFSKHARLIEHIDEFSSGFAFKEWRKLLGRLWNGLIEEQVRTREHSELSEPRSWLAREGWKRAA